MLSLPSQRARNRPPTPVYAPPYTVPECNLPDIRLGPHPIVYEPGYTVPEGIIPDIRRGRIQYPSSQLRSGSEYQVCQFCSSFMI